MRAQWQKEKEAIARLREIKEEMEEVRTEIERAERQYDLNRAAELQYGRLRELERQLKAEEEQSPARRRALLLKEEVDEQDIAGVVSPLDRHPGQPAAGGRAGEAVAPGGAPAPAGDRPGRGRACRGRCRAAGPRRPEGPEPPGGQLHLPGPTGVGKTELAAPWPSPCSTTSGP